MGREAQPETLPYRRSKRNGPEGPRLRQRGESRLWRAMIQMWLRHPTGLRLPLEGVVVWKGRTAYPQRGELESWKGVVSPRRPARSTTTRGTDAQSPNGPKAPPRE